MAERPIEDALSRLVPAEPAIDRDALLFAAGRASAPRSPWRAVAGLFAVTNVLTVLILTRPEPVRPTAVPVPLVPGPWLDGPGFGSPGPLALTLPEPSPPIPADRLLPARPPLSAVSTTFRPEDF